MQKLWKVTCDFCGKHFDRQKDLPRGKLYTLHNISFEIFSQDTGTQGARTLNRIDLCNTCALKFATFLKENVKQPETLHEVLQNFHEPNPNDNNSYYRHTAADDSYDNRVYCSLEDYEKEPWRK